MSPLETVIAALGLTIKADFVPFSQSRNATRKTGEDATQDKRSLNWKVTLLKGEREILTTDYGAGIGHCPAYKNPAFKSTVHARNMSTDQTTAIALEIEQGYAAKVAPWGLMVDKTRPLLPNTADVIHSLVLDGGAIDYPTYEEWAADFGYDPDSRKGEAIYRQCLAIGLKLRAVLGDVDLTKLREAAQDY